MFMILKSIVSDRELEGSFAIVTGGSRGIGRAVVEALLERGATVALTYRRHAAEAAALVAAHAGRASAHFLDLLDPSSVAACFAEAVARQGPPDVVVNNAAVGSATVAHYEADPARRDRAIFEVNALGALAVCEQALRAFGDRGGRAPAKLINIASVGGLAVFPSMTAADNMSKAALVHLTKQLAAENAHTAVDVFAVCPGATDTAMLRESTLDRLGEHEARRLVARLPKGRLIEPREIARVVAFLAAPASTVLHGAVIDASMGLAVHPGLVTGGVHA
jgi:NAD(P)-dependent dehydrogenase (short-subunit alcohol dehydrogenase family)